MITCEETKSSITEKIYKPVGEYATIDVKLSNTAASHLTNEKESQELKKE
jgi:hypothetical protein